MSGVHDGHRSRMKERFRLYGLDNFDDHNVLELLLFYAIPRRDVNETAHALLQHFGSLDAVFDAPLAELAQVKGVGESAATLLKLSVAVGRRYLLAKSAAEAAVLDCTEAAAAYISPYFIGERDEVVYMICLDDANRALGCWQVGRGVVNTVEVSIRRIAEVALKCNASGIILAHNHVAGVAVPSREDYETTERVFDALSRIGVTLCDHLIVAGAEAYSVLGKCIAQGTDEKK